MITIDDIKQQILKGERVTLEAKLAEKDVPKSIWGTYSAFANTNGGLILLGVDEDEMMVERELHQSGESHFGGVGHGVEHRLAEEERGGYSGATCRLYDSPGVYQQ